MKFGGEQSSEMTEVLSHVFSEAQVPLANPQGNTTSFAKAALLERKFLPLPVISVLHPLGMSYGVLPKVGPQRQMERDRGREKLTKSLPFPPAELGQSACLTTLFSPCMGAEENLNHQPHVWLTE